MSDAADKTLGLIRISGADAADFLHAQLTCRVDDLAPDERRLGAWCSAKGRVRAVFRIMRRGEDIYLSLPNNLLASTLTKLKLFVLRSRVELTAASPGAEGLAELASVDIAQQIRSGQPEVYPETQELFLPQMLNLDLLGGIDFKKGCYPGQEIIARTHYRGQLKRRMYVFRLEETEVPAPGAPVYAANESIGNVVDAAAGQDDGVILLAVIQIEARQRDLRLGSISGPGLKAVDLPYSVP